ncbi:MAG: response regulator, partial [Planctomycetota bacterium]
MDDDEIARSAIALMLERMGCKVTSASNAQEAVSMFLTGKFDLIALDYRMPGLDGMALHKVLSQEFGAGKRTLGFAPRKLPTIVVVTAYADEPDVIRGLFGESVV